MNKIDQLFQIHHILSQVYHIQIDNGQVDHKRQDTVDSPDAVMILMMKATMYQGDRHVVMEIVIIKGDLQRDMNHYQLKKMNHYQLKKVNMDQVNY